MMVTLVQHEASLEPTANLLDEHMNLQPAIRGKPHFSRENSNKEEKPDCSESDVSSSSLLSFSKGK